MAFGLQISTTNGIVDLADMRAARLAFKKRVFTTSGTLTIPDFNPGKGCVFAVVNDGKREPDRFRSGTDTLSWFPFKGVSNPSSDITFFFLRFV